MTTIQQLKQLNTDALRNQQKQLRTVYQFLLAKAQTIAKNKQEQLEDKHLHQAAQKVIKMLEDSGSSTAQQEIDIVKQFLPKEMSEEELKQVVLQMKNEGKQLKEVMTYLDSTGLTVNKKLASEVFKNG